MKAGILTFSQTGNTLKIGNCIATGLRENGFEVDHTQYLQKEKFKPNGADLIGIGSPCYESRPAEIVPEFLKNRRFDFKGKKAFVFITSSTSPGKSLWRLSRVVAITGAQVIGGIQITGVSTAPTMFGLTPNRPNQNDFEYAQVFGKAIAENMKNGTALPNQYLIDPNTGSLFFDKVGLIANYIKKKILSPPGIVAEKCDLCGTCIYECPVGNFSMEDKKIKVHKKCIVCWRCWHVCPNEAISTNISPSNGLIERLIWSERMERFFGELKPGQDRGQNLYQDVLARKIKLKYDRKNPSAEFGFVD